MIETLYAKRGLIVSPHADDESIGLHAKMSRMITNGGQLFVAYTASGVPLYENDTCRKDHASTTEYYHVRRDEALTVLKKLGIDKSNVRFLNRPDVGLCEVIREVRDDLADVIKEQNPHYVFSCPFEGANPDHDITRLAVEKAIEDVNPNITLLEYALYHNKGGIENFNTFFNTSGGESVIVLTEEEKWAKKQSFETYRSQSGGILSRVPIGIETIRPALEYDFSLPFPRPVFWKQFYYLPIDPGDVELRIREFLETCNK